MSFEQTQFGDGNVIFHCTDFNDGDVTFGNAWFGKGDVSFFGAQFQKGNIDFTACRFDKGDVGFIYCNFGSGDFIFNQVKLDDRNVFFKDAQSPEGQLQLCNTQFSLPLDLSGLKNTSNISQLSIQDSQFHSGLNLSGLTLKHPVNLLNTNPTTAIVVGNLECDFEVESVAKKGFWSVFKKAKHPTSTQYFSRLREIAQQNNNGIAEEYFFKKEKRSARWHIINPLQSLLDLAFDWSCDYGRSARKPLLTICMLALLNITTLWLINDKTQDCQSVSRLVATGISVSVPFAGSSGVVKNDWLQQCTSDSDEKDKVLLLFTISGLVSSLMFLSIFFTLFNRYKVKPKNLS